jgi:hypothetical protein
MKKILSGNYQHIFLIIIIFVAYLAIINNKAKSENMFSTINEIIGRESVLTGSSIIFVCKADNDLFRILSKSDIKQSRYNSVETAIKAAPDGSGVLILADGYPLKTTNIPESLIDEASRKNLRLYIEYPENLPGLEIGKSRTAHFERLVVSSDFFEPALQKMQILAVNALNFTSVDVKESLIVAARVAGFDNAVFGLPKETSPILFEYKKNKVLVSTTKLSHFVTGRYGPQSGWKVIWEKILGWLIRDKAIELVWTPMVRPAYDPNAQLPPDVEKQALKRGVEWFINSKLLMHPSRIKEIKDVVANHNGLTPTPPKDSPIGDGSMGILEAPISIIRSDGSQMQSVSLRSDCNGESAMALALGGKILNDEDKISIAKNILDFWLFKSDAQKKERADINHGAYGLIAWGTTTPAWEIANYGDDNARFMMGALSVAAILDHDGWDESIMKCLLANLRTTGQLGFRDDRIDIPDLTAKGWKPFFERKIISYSPHMEAYLWACFLWAYQKTGYELFYNRAESAIRMTMDVYTDGWRWTNGLAQEKARILLPLAWLLRVKDTPEHREWLNKAVDGLIKLQEPCGAIREELGLPGKGMFPPPDSNETYGLHEASLIQKNGDPVSDLLYTTNFALLGLHEAASVTRDKKIKDAEEKLIKFLCRIQNRSEAQPSLDGGWFRAFDFKRWEAWASNADAGWGAWAIESGWTQGWITSVLAMRQMNTSLWDLTAKSKISRYFEQYRKIMLPDEIKW